MSEVSNWFVVAMGIGTVFVGLISIVVICKIMSAICNAGTKKAGKKADVKIAPAANVVAAPIENRQEILAAVCAVAAEELGTDISAIRVLSLKKI